MAKSVEVVEHDRRWAVEFADISAELQAILGRCVVAVHHIGSTAIPGICAKPIIDLLMEVDDLDRLDVLAPRLENIGYRARGEYGIAGRRYFSRGATDSGSAIHLHAFLPRDDQVVRHINFRDFLRRHPLAAQKYSDLKRALADEFADDRDAYQAGKADFIAAMDRQAARWAARSDGS